MKKVIVYVFCFFYFIAPAFCEEDSLADTHKSLKEEAFVVETDDSSVSDSLNRISGNIDLGFSTPEQSYNSADHTRAGPFGRAEQQDQSQSY